MVKECAGAPCAWGKGKNVTGIESIIAIVMIIANSRSNIINQYLGWYICSITSDCGTAILVPPLSPVE